MRWNGTNEDLSNAEISFYFTFCFIENILPKRKEKNALAINSNKSDPAYQHSVSFITHFFDTSERLQKKYHTITTEIKLFHSPSMLRLCGIWCWQYD